LRDSEKGGGYRPETKHRYVVCSEEKRGGKKINRFLSLKLIGGKITTRTPFQMERGKIKFKKKT